METLYVIKIGGNIIDDAAALDRFLGAFASVPGKKVLVHGGGKLATRIAETMGIPQRLVDGRRITDADTLRIVTMVYAGYVNKTIVARLQALGCDAAGFCGADGNSVLAHKRVVSGTDYGFAGDIDRVNGALFQAWLASGQALVFAPITHDGKGQLLNTNADTVAQEIAKACSRFYRVSLVYSFEKAGVLLDVNDASSVIPAMRAAEYEKLKSEQKIFAGMIPKLDNAFTALREGVDKVIIGNAAALDQLLTGTSGTTIHHD